MKGLWKYNGLIQFAGLLVLLPLLIWNWGIHPTIDLRRNVREQTHQIATAQADTTGSTPALLKPDQEAEATDNGIKSGNMLYRLAPLLERYDVTAERYTPYCLHSDSGAELYAGELLLSGGFISLTRLLDELEKHSGSEQIVSVRYVAAVHPQTRRKQLQMTVVFQQITQNKRL